MEDIVKFNLNYNKDLFVMDDENKKSIVYKINLFKEAFNVIPGLGTTRQTIKMLTFKELLSDDGLELLKLFTKKGYDIESLLNEYEIENIEVSEATDYLFRLFDLTQQIYNYDEFNTRYSATNTLNMFINKHKDISNLIFMKIASECPEIIRKDKLNDIAENIISTGAIEDVQILVSLIDRVLPNFRSYPLIMLNDSVSREDRISLLKKKYKQKDLAAYMSMFEEKTTDLLVIDDFIEATVLQNNRVTNKKEGIVKVFKYLFFNTVYSWNKNGKWGKYINITPFMLKYKEYFKDEEFLGEVKTSCIAMSRDSYTRKQNFQTFLNFMLKETPVEETVEIAEKVKSVISSTNFEEILNEKAEHLIKNSDINNLKSLISSIKDKKQLFDLSARLLYTGSLGRICDNNEEFTKFIRENIFNKISLFDISPSYRSEGLIHELMCDANAQIERNTLNLFRRKFFSNEDATVFIPAKKIRELDGSGSFNSILDRTESFFKRMIYVDKILDDDNYKEELDLFARNYLFPMYFLEDKSIITENLMNLYDLFKDSKRSYYYYGSNPEANISRVIGIYNSVLDIMKIVMPKFSSKDDVENTINEIQDTIDSFKLILNIQ